MARKDESEDGLAGDSTVLPPDLHETIRIYGDGNIVVNINEYMINITNTVNQYVTQANVADDVKDLVKQLDEQVVALVPYIGLDVARDLADDVKRLSQELASPQPRSAWYGLLLLAIKETAQALGEIGNPAVDTVRRLKLLLVPE